MKTILPAFACAAALLLAGCDKEATLHSGLEEQQANLVMAALLDAGIACHKSPGAEGTWNVTVVESKFAEAVDRLEELRERGFCVGKQRLDDLALRPVKKG